MSTDPKPDRVTAIYDAIDAFQRTHRLPGLQHAQLRGLLAEHLARAVPVESAPSAVRARVLHDAADVAEDVAERLRKDHEFERSTGALDVMTELRRLAAERVRDAADRSRLLLWAADRLERMPGYPRLVLPEELLTELRRLAAEPTANTETVRDDYERTTGHLITCLAVAGGGSDPDCPVCHPPFGVNGCTCIPFTRQGGVPRYCGPADTVDMISGWERRSDCPHHKPAVVEQPDTQTREAGK